ETKKIYALIHPTTWTYSTLGMAETYRRCSKLTREIINDGFCDFIKKTNEYLRNRERAECREVAAKR
ncbi:MAG: hypothetical protein JW800_05385, partial [Candidatus Omnitrophica bacterium]|nr:hypothetical protein [Candidatus Omnitrophota bacterium]